MNVLITYDVNSRHPEVKAAMKRKGYMDNWRETNGSTTYYLPNTTLWKNNIAPNQALSDMKSVASQLGVRLIRCVSAEFNTWSAIPGEPFHQSATKNY